MASRTLRLHIIWTFQGLRWPLVCLAPGTGCDQTAAAVAQHIICMKYGVHSCGLAFNAWSPYCGGACECAAYAIFGTCAVQPPPTRRRKSRRNSTRSLRNAPGPLTRQLSAGSVGPGATTPAQTTPRVIRRQMSEASLSGSDTASLASGDSGMGTASLSLPWQCALFRLHIWG